MSQIKKQYIYFSKKEKKIKEKRKLIKGLMREIKNIYHFWPDRAFRDRYNFRWIAHVHKNFFMP